MNIKAGDKFDLELFHYQFMSQDYAGIKINEKMLAR